MSRIVLSTALLFIAPFSPAFFAVYAVCGATDFLDGFLARHFNKESCFGAKLDSISDLVLAAAIAIILILNVHFPLWVWAGVIVVALIRIVSYLVGFIKFHTLSSLHTYLNKATGAVLFFFPVMYILCGINISAGAAIAVALLSSLEELIITTKAKTLDRDCKGIFIK